MSILKKIGNLFSGKPDKPSGAVPEAVLNSNREHLAKLQNLSNLLGAQAAGEEAMNRNLQRIRKEARG